MTYCCSFLNLLFGHFDDAWLGLIMISALGTIAQTMPYSQLDARWGSSNLRKNWNTSSSNMDTGRKRRTGLHPSGPTSSRSSAQKKGLRQWIAKSDHFEVYFDDGKEAVRLREANASRTHLMVFCYSKLRTCCLAAVQLSSPVLDLNMLRM